MRQQFPDREQMVVKEVSGPGAYCRRPHWPDNASIFARAARSVFEQLAEGIGVEVDYLEGNRQMPFISAIRGLGKSATAPVISLILGIWDQTWRSAYQDAVSTITTAPAELEADVCWTFDSDAAGGGIYWEPEGLLLHRSGRIWHISRWTDLAEAFEAAELRVRLLIPSTTYAVSASASLSLAGHERNTAHWLYPDASCFYDQTLDILVVLPKPTKQKIDNEQARIWTLRPNEDLDGFFSSVSSFDLGPEDARRGWGCVGVASGRLLRLDFPGNEIERFQLNEATLEWESLGLGSAFSGTWGIHYSGPGWRADTFDGGPARNYSPPYTQGKFYCCATVRTEVGSASDWIDYRLRELAVAGNGDLSEIDLVQINSVSRTEPVQLGICEDWAADHRDAIAGNTNIPASGDYDEIGFTDESIVVTNGYPPESELHEWTLIEWTEWRTRRWLGCAYENFAHEWSSGGASNNWPSLSTPGYPTTCGGVPLGPAALPAQSPNRAWWGRAFWSGQPSDKRDWTGIIPRSDGASLATADGWRYHLALVPDQPVWLPNSTKGDLWQPNHPQSYDQQFYQYRSHAFANVHPSIPFPETYYHDYKKAERRQISWVSPVMRWTWRTVLFSISPSGDVYERELSARWPGLPYPGRLGAAGPNIHTISEELSVGVNGYQIFTVPRHNLLGVIIDHLETALGDPAPMVLLLDRSAPATLPEAYRIPASSIYPEACLELCTEDATYEGEGDYLDPDYWARIGQYRYLLHGADESGPRGKIVSRASEDLLILGWQAVQRVAPTTGTPGQTYNGLSLFRLNADSADSLGGQNNIGTWTWGTSRRGNDNTHGPRVLRSLAVASDRMIYGSWVGEVGKPGLREIK